jgi:hypothetical protein
VRASYLTALGLVACGGGGGASVDAGPPDAGSCSTVQVLETTFTLDTPARTSLHPRLLFDGTALWVVYSSPPDETSNNFATWLTRVGCDGQTVAGPTLVSQSPELNSVSPDIARNGDDVLVAWAGDDGDSASIMNLQVYSRAFAPDGSPRGDEVKLVTTAGGQTLTQNNWMPRLQPVPGASGFWLAGSRVLPSIDRFSAYVQRLDGQGAPLGDAVDLDPRTGSGTFNPALAVTGGGDLVVGWQRVPDAAGTSNYIEIARVEGGTQVTDVEPGLTDDDTTASDYVSAAAAGERAYVAFHGGPDDHDGSTSEDVQVHLDTQPIGTDRVVLGGAGMDVLAQVAAHPQAGGAIAWVKLSVSRTLNLQPFTDTASGVALAGEKLTVPSELGVGTNGPPALVHLHDHVYAVAWIESEDGVFRIRLRLVELVP